MNKNLLLTIDVEEFDVMASRFSSANTSVDFNVSLNGTLRMSEFLDRIGVKTTFFVTGQFAIRFPNEVSYLAERHEIASHGYSHSDEYSDSSKQLTDRLSLAREILEDTIHKRVLGFRAPRMNPPNLKLLSNVGFLYDSSIHPTFLSPKSKSFLSPTGLTRSHGVIKLPLSVVPFIRLPLFWAAFQNFGTNYSVICTLLCWKRDYVMLNFHNWEFVEITNLDIPWYYKRNTGQKLEMMLEKYLKWIRKSGYVLRTISEYLGL